MTKLNELTNKFIANFEPKEIEQAIEFNKQLDDIISWVNENPSDYIIEEAIIEGREQIIHLQNS